MATTRGTLAAELPSYAPDGSQGYFLSVTRTAHVGGWIYVAKDGRTVYATIGGAALRCIGTVTSPGELTPTWITEHADAILGAFCQSGQVTEGHLSPEVSPRQGPPASRG